MPNELAHGKPLSEVQFLTLAEVVEVHRGQIARYRGQTGVRDLGMLLSALAVPQATFDGVYLHCDLFEMAAAYAFHLCRNHPFVDGNKRTALASALVFLELNGVSVHDPHGLLYDAMVNVAAGTFAKGDLAYLFRCLGQGTRQA